MKKDKALSIILDSKSINVVVGASYAGMLKSVIRGINVEPINYPFDMACLPRNRSKDEFDRCAKICPVKLTTWHRNRFADKFQCFERIIVWHDGTANGVLMMGLLCMTETRPIMEVNIDKKFHYKDGSVVVMGAMEEEQLRESIKFLKRVTTRQKEKYVSIYKRFSTNENELKTNVNGKIVRLSQKKISKIRSLAIRYSEKPCRIYNIIGRIMGEYCSEYHFGDSVYMSILANMIHDGKLFVTSIHLFPRSPHVRPVFDGIRLPRIMFEGHNLSEAYQIYLTSSKEIADESKEYRCLTLDNIYEDVLRKSDDQTVEKIKAIVETNGCSHEDVFYFAISVDRIACITTHCTSSNEIKKMVSQFLMEHSTGLIEVLVNLRCPRDTEIRNCDVNDAISEIRDVTKSEYVNFGCQISVDKIKYIEIDIIAGYK